LKITLDKSAGINYLINIRGNQPPGDGKMIHFIQFSQNILTELTHDLALEAKADRLGLMIGTAGLVAKSNWDNLPAVAGNTYAVKDTLKANGARWNGLAKAWTFPTLEALAVAVNAIPEVN
jgi:hypothetical protein